MFLYIQFFLLGSSSSLKLPVPAVIFASHPQLHNFTLCFSLYPSCHSPPPHTPRFSSCPPPKSVATIQFPFIIVELNALILVLSQTSLKSETSYVLHGVEMMVGKVWQVIFLIFRLFLKYKMIFDLGNQTDVSAGLPPLSNCVLSC